MRQLQGTIEDIGIQCVFTIRIIQHIISLPVVKFSSSQEYCPADKRMTERIQQTESICCSYAKMRENEAVSQVQQFVQ